MYLDGKGRTIFIIQGISDDWGSFYHKHTCSLARIKSPSLPMRPTRQEAEQDLVKYATKKKWEISGKSVNSYLDNIDKIVLIENTARHFGKKLNPVEAGRRYRWYEDGLTVYVNESSNFTLAVFEGKVVCSTTINNFFFFDGPWWKIVKSAAVRIKEKEILREDSIQRRLFPGGLPG